MIFALRKRDVVAVELRHLACGGIGIVSYWMKESEGRGREGKGGEGRGGEGREGKEGGDTCARC